MEKGTINNTTIDHVAPSKLLIMEVQAHSLSFKVKDKSHPLGKTILDNITLKLRPGKMTAIMGASGSGKTSLLYAMVIYSQNLIMKLTA